MNADGKYSRFAQKNFRTYSENKRTFLFFS